MNKDKSLFVYLLLVAMLGIQICSQCQTVIKLVHTKKSHYECSRMHMPSILIMGIFSYRLKGSPALSKVFYLELTCSNLKVFSSRRMCTNLKQKSEWNSLFYYSVLTFSNAFPKNTDSKIHISNPYINLLNLRM